MADGLNSAPDDRFCDLVMKGGITSGVVYPKAIAKLAEVYRFRSIGGTSAGAIAAVCTAAAEYRRRGHKEGGIKAGDMAGFDGLRNMANELSVKGKLFSLFQPGNGRRRLFTVVEAALNARNKWTRTGKILWGLMVGYFAGTVLSAVLAWLTYMATASIVAGILMFIVLWLVLTLLGVLFNVTGPVVDANYGLCSGMPAQATLRKRLWRRLTGQPDPQALMPWLHQKVQEFAGLPLDKPLTFGMLWNAQGPAAGVVRHTEGRPLDRAADVHDQPEPWAALHPAARRRDAAAVLPSRRPGGGRSGRSHRVARREVRRTEEADELHPACRSAYRLAAASRGGRLPGGAGGTHEPELSAVVHRDPAVRAGREGVAREWPARDGHRAPVPVLRRRHRVELPDSPVRRHAAEVADVRDAARDLAARSGTGDSRRAAREAAHQL